MRSLTLSLASASGPAPMARRHPVALGLLAVLGLAGCAERADDTPAPAATAASADAVAAVKLTGTPFGTSPAYKPGYEFGKAFDGNLATFFDAQSASGGYTGLELAGTNYSKVVQIRYAPRQGSGNRMVGGKFQGSWTSATSGYRDLHIVATAPGNGWQTIRITNGDKYRWLRYVGPDGAHGNIAELEFYTEGSGTTPPPAGAVSGPPAGTGAWTKSFEDNFDTFDAGKWVKRWACGNGQPAGCTFQDRLGTAYEDANVWVANGKLHIKTERKALRGNAFTSGVVTTGKAGGFMQRYGYFEVRMKPASSPGNDPCFWAFPLSKPSAQPFKEIDFAEFGGAHGGQVVATTCHMPGLGSQTFSARGNWTAAFRTYGVLWEANKVTLYIDGVLQPGAITKNIVDEAGVLILSDEVRKDGGAWFGNSDNFTGPVTSEVEWVRVWRRN